MDVSKWNLILVLQDKFANAESICHIYKNKGERLKGKLNKKERKHERKRIVSPKWEVGRNIDIKERRQKEGKPINIQN